MKTFFHSRTLYEVLRHAAPSLTLPTCFVELDEYFDTVFNDIAEAYRHQAVMHAENVCRRMADVDFFAYLVEKELERPNRFHGALVVGSLLVAYFSSAKALLDSISILLTKAYSLGLPPKDRDFGKGRFWNTLLDRASARHGAYASFRDLMNDVIDWRDSALHRITPFVLVHSPGDPDSAPPDSITIRLWAKPDISLPGAIAVWKDIPWVEPTYFCSLWRDKFIELCALACEDVRKMVRAEEGTPR